MTLGRLLDVAGHALTGERLDLVRRACTVAAYWHRDQVRHSGDPYITHSVAVATILAERGMDHELICAGLPHDVLRDTTCPESELAAEWDELRRLSTANLSGRRGVRVASGVIIAGAIPPAARRPPPAPAPDGWRNGWPSCTRCPAGGPGRGSRCGCWRACRAWRSLWSWPHGCGPSGPDSGAVTGAGSLGRCAEHPATP